MVICCALAGSGTDAMGASVCSRCSVVCLVPAGLWGDTPQTPTVRPVGANSRLDRPLSAGKLKRRAACSHQ